MKRIKKYATDRAGFSFSELMIVMAMVAILSAIATPSILRGLPEKRLKNAARNLYADMQRARLQAVQENRKISVKFETGPEGDFYYFDTDANGTFTAGEFRRNLYEYGDVSYGFGKATKDWHGDDIPSDRDPVDNATFKPTGTVGAGSVFLENSKKYTCYAVTRINYGAVTIRHFNGEKWDEKK